MAKYGIPPIKQLMIKRSKWSWINEIMSYSCFSGIKPWDLIYHMVNRWFQNFQAAILEAILDYNKLDHIWNEHPSFFKPSRGPLQGSKVKMRAHIFAHRTPLSSRTISSWISFDHLFYLCLQKEDFHRTTHQIWFLHSSFL